VSFKDFPWFRDASIRQISHVELPSASCWPAPTSGGLIDERSEGARPLGDRGKRAQDGLVEGEERAIEPSGELNE